MGAQARLSRMGHGSTMFPSGRRETAGPSSLPWGLRNHGKGEEGRRTCASRFSCLFFSSPSSSVRRGAIVSGLPRDVIQFDMGRAPPYPLTLTYPNQTPSLSLSLSLSQHSLG